MDRWYFEWACCALYNLSVLPGFAWTVFGSVFVFLVKICGCHTIACDERMFFCVCLESPYKELFVLSVVVFICARRCACFWSARLFACNRCAPSMA